MSQRGSVPRRKPNLDYVPPVKPTPIVVAPAPVYQDNGKSVVPSNGSVKIFSFRFPTVGEVSNASINFRDAPADAVITVKIAIGDEVILEQKWDQASSVLRFEGKFPVDDQEIVSVHLSQYEQKGAVSVETDIAYLYQEKLHARVQLGI